MKARHHLATLLAVTLLAGVFGCGSDDDNPITPTSSVTHEEADDVATQVVVSNAIFGEELGTVFGSTPAAPVTRMSQAQWDTSFVTGSGLSYQASRTFYDAGDNELPDYGPTAVRLHWTSHAGGLIETARDSATVGHATVLDIRGIEQAADSLHLDGAVTDSLLNKFTSFDGTRKRFYSWRSIFTLLDIRFAKSQIQTGPRPVGVATMAIAVDRLRSYDRLDIASHFDVTVVITYDGSNFAHLLVDGKYAYHWDLTNGQIIRV